MNKEGYVYVLMNPSMPNLLKIGQTKKNPEERAKELSSSTGVATNFIVVYKQKFNDCERAEHAVHIILEEEGIRVNKNREFFEAETSDVIEIISQLKKHEDEILSFDNNVSDDEFRDNLDEDFLLGNDFPSSALENPWDAFEEQADAYYYGFDGELIDYELAFEYYEKAFKLNSPTAPHSLGKMYADGEGVNKNIKKAVLSYREGIKRGNSICWVELGILYEEDNTDNVLKAFNKYIDSLSIVEEKYKKIQKQIYSSTSIAQQLENIFSTIYDMKIEDNSISEVAFKDIMNRLENHKDDIIKELDGHIVYVEDNPMQGRTYIAYLKRKKRFINDYFKPILQKEDKSEIIDEILEDKSEMKKGILHKISSLFN